MATLKGDSIFIAYVAIIQKALVLKGMQMHAHKDIYIDEAAKIGV